MVALAITWPGLGAGDLRRRAKRSSEPAEARRLLAIALVLEGSSREDAARAAGMDRQTLRDWVVRYNESGPAGLANRRKPGRTQFLNPAQVAQVVAWVEAGPDPAADGVVRWRRIDLATKIAAEFKVTLAPRSVGALLHRLGFRRLSVRPQHPSQDPTALEAHKKTLPT